jgi:hypothetical protein
MDANSSHGILLVMNVFILSVSFEGSWTAATYGVAAHVPIHLSSAKSIFVKANIAVR